MMLRTSWVLLALAACGGTPPNVFGPVDGGPAPGDFDPTDAALSESAAPSGSGPVFFYANTDTTLYRLDPLNLSTPMARVGDFDCVPSQASVMTDIAVDKSGRLYGVSPAAAWPLSIQGSVVHCDAKWPLPQDTHFNGLTVAPENTVAAEEVLVGGNATGQLFRIDQGSGATTQVGTLGVDPVTGRPWTISGDMVFFAGVGNGGEPLGFATVRTCTSPTSCDLTDTLIEIDVKAVHAGAQSVLRSIRGPVSKGSGGCTNPSSPTRFGSIFGVVALRDRVYGFSRKGDFLDVASADGAGCLVWNDSTAKFAGAGITTLAPVSAPPR